MTKDELKAIIGAELSKQGKSLLDLEDLLNKQANEKTAASATETLTKLLGFGGHSLMSLIKWPMAAGAFAGLPAAAAGFEMYKQNQNSNKRILEMLEEKRKIEEATKEIEAKKSLSGYAQ